MVTIEETLTENGGFWEALAGQNWLTTLKRYELKNE